ncbi:MAG TPA: hypothetical protein VFU36_15130, partial [Jatrophihabitans sp.]|nr:hypothetical protein [Jatrophihabitans sp.]
VGEAAALPVAEPADRRIPSAGGLFGSRRRLVATGAGLVALCAVSGITALPISHRWTHARNVRYVRNLRTDVAALDRQGPWSLYTTYAPAVVVRSDAGYYSQTTVIAALVTGHPVSADELAEPMYVADPDGHLRPARFRSLAGVPDSCGTGRLQPLSRSLPRGLWNVQLSYRVSGPTTLRFALDPGTGGSIEATGSARGFPVSGSGRLTFALRPSAIAGLRLDATQAGVCLSDVQIGRPVPA